MAEQPHPVKILLGDRLGAAVLLIAVVSGATLYLGGRLDASVGGAIAQDNAVEVSTYATRSEASELARLLDRVATKLEALDRRVDVQDRDLRDLRRAGSSVVAPVPVPAAGPR